MSYLVLARKWRPQYFEEIVGQRHVSLTLANAIKTDRLSHAYLFSGPRGVGKTSMARILAKALNCEQGPTSNPCNKCESCQSITAGHALDVLEIDGASNRGIDDVRKLRESVKYAPSSLRSKVYIIDEVHMLTTDAFNALLKTLEEPPKHVHFIMATTEPMKVPATILSRCQRFDFGRVSTDDLKGHLKRIAVSEKVDIDDDSLLLIARKADGSVRDSLTLLDQVFATGAGPFSAGQVEELLGLSGSDLHFQISDAVISNNPQDCLSLIQSAYSQGTNLQELAEELVHHFRNVMLCSLGKNLDALIETTADEQARLTKQSEQARCADALRWLRVLLDVSAVMRKSSHPRVHLEVALVEMATLPRAVDLGRVIDRLQQTAPTSASPAPAPREKPGGPVAYSEKQSISTIGEESLGNSNGPTPVASDQTSVGSSASASPPRPSSSGGGEDINQISEIWNRVVGKIREQKAFLGSCLHESRVAGFLDGRIQVVLADANGFKGEQVKKPANRRLIMLAIEEIAGRPIGLQLTKDSGAEVSSASPARVATSEPAPAPAERSVPDSSPAGRAEISGANAANNSASGDLPIDPKPPIPVSDNSEPGLIAGSIAAGEAPAATGDEQISPDAEAYSPKDQARRVAQQLDGDIIGPAL